MIQERLTQLTETKRNDLYAYRGDPVGFVEEHLLGFLWSKQKAMAKALARHNRVAVKSCHDFGKTAIARRLGAWWLSVHPREISRIHKDANFWISYRPPLAMPGAAMTEAPDQNRVAEPCPA
jgi:hypothetical protein